MKKIKLVATLLLIASVAMGVCACGVKEVDEKDFRDVVKDVLDCDKEDLYKSEGKETYADYIETYISYVGEDSDKFTVTYYEYEDEEAAKYMFDMDVAMAKFLKSHDCVTEGKVKTSGSYITYDGKIISSYDEKAEYEYGGIYMAGPYIITVETNSSKDKDIQKVDDILKELGLPRP